jgi:aminoglycoside 3-N-acetyltransferase I
MSARANFTIRQVCPPDFELMHGLLTMFGEAFEEADTYSRARPTNQYFEQLLRSDHFIALAALEDGIVVGGIAAYELKKFEQERSEVYIYDLAVAQDYRRQGIATALIEEVKEVAKKRGAYVIFVQADYGDGPAIALYSNFGVREKVLSFDIAILDGKGAA